MDENRARIAPGNLQNNTPFIVQNDKGDGNGGHLDTAWAIDAERYDFDGVVDEMTYAGIA
jgi:hypothetical protein